MAGRVCAKMTAAWGNAAGFEALSRVHVPLTTHLFLFFAQSNVTADRCPLCPRNSCQVLQKYFQVTFYKSLRL